MLKALFADRIDANKHAVSMGCRHGRTRSGHPRGAAPSPFAGRKGVDTRDKHGHDGSGVARSIRFANRAILKDVGILFIPLRRPSLPAPAEFLSV